MTDPIGLIGSTGLIQRPAALMPGSARELTEGPSFKPMFQQRFGKGNELQNDATTAVEELASGRRSDIESVMIATQKADVAFRMLLQVRIKVMDAYDEIKQLRI